MDTQGGRNGVPADQFAHNEPRAELISISNRPPFCQQASPPLPGRSCGGILMLAWLSLRSRITRSARSRLSKEQPCKRNVLHVIHLYEVVYTVEHSAAG